MDSNGVRILVDLLTLAHLHTSRATVPLQVKQWICNNNITYLLMMLFTLSLDLFNLDLTESCNVICQEYQPEWLLFSTE